MTWCKMPSVRVIQEVVKNSTRLTATPTLEAHPASGDSSPRPAVCTFLQVIPAAGLHQTATFFTRQTLSTPLVFRREKTTTRWKVTINYPRENQTGSHRGHQIGLKRKEKGVFLLMSTTITIKRKLRNCSRCAVRVCVGTSSSQIKIYLCWTTAAIFFETSSGRWKVAVLV